MTRTHSNGLPVGIDENKFRRRGGSARFGLRNIGRLAVALNAIKLYISSVCQGRRTGLPKVPTGRELLGRTRL